MIVCVHASLGLGRLEVKRPRAIACRAVPVGLGLSIHTHTRARSPARSFISNTQESFGELKDAMDTKSFNIFMSMVKEKVEGLKPYAQVRGDAHEPHDPPSTT